MSQKESLARMTLDMNVMDWSASSLPAYLPESICHAASAGALSGTRSVERLGMEGVFVHSGLKCEMNTRGRIG